MKHLHIVVIVISWSMLGTLTPLRSNAQLRISLSIVSKKPLETEDFRMIMHFRNNGNKRFDIYPLLSDYFHDRRFQNIEVIVQKKEGKVYQAAQNGMTIDFGDEGSYEEYKTLFDSLNSNRIELRPGDSAVACINLNYFKWYDKGFYRVKIKYFNQTDHSREKIESSWVYFECVKYKDAIRLPELLPILKPIRVVKQ